MGRPRTKKTAPIKGSVEHRLNQALKATGKSQADLARAVAGLDADKVSKIVRGERRLDATELAPAAEFLGVRLEWLATADGDMIEHRQRSVDIVGFVGAGAEVLADGSQLDGSGQDNVDLDFDVPGSCKAVIVRGTSMLPAYEDGDVLVYDGKPADPRSLLNRRCVVQLTDGRIFVKRLRRGTLPDLYTLESFNADPIEDAEIDWVAKIKAVVPR